MSMHEVLCWDCEGVETGGREVGTEERIIVILGHPSEPWHGLTIMDSLEL
jgi:hypothetical protein